MKAYETRDDSNMKMYNDLCIDVFDENRKNNWKKIVDDIGKSEYFESKKPKPLVDENVEAKKPVAKKRTPARLKKVVEVKPLD